MGGQQRPGAGGHAALPLLPEMEELNADMILTTPVGRDNASAGVVYVPLNEEGQHYQFQQQQAFASEQAHQQAFLQQRGQQQQQQQSEGHHQFREANNQHQQITTPGRNNAEEERNNNFGCQPS
mmetsp:Transcript_50960/g.74550  ORF Transcript_50960/g.74550 Transcript_50960/m.74550 type:complete len:124 (-) Transcript_50960:118-489(-)